MPKRLSTTDGRLTDPGAVKFLTGQMAALRAMI